MALTQARLLAVIEAGETLAGNLKAVLRQLQTATAEGASAQDLWDVLAAAGLLQPPAEALTAIAIERHHYDRTARINVKNRIRQRSYGPNPFSLAERDAVLAGDLLPEDLAVPKPRPEHRKMLRRGQGQDPSADFYESIAKLVDEPEAKPETSTDDLGIDLPEPSGQSEALSRWESFK